MTLCQTPGCGHARSWHSRNKNQCLKCECFRFIEGVKAKVTPEETLKAIGIVARNKEASPELRLSTIRTMLAPPAPVTPKDELTNILTDLIVKKVGKELPQPLSEYYLTAIAEAREAIEALTKSNREDREG